MEEEWQTVAAKNEVGNSVVVEHSRFPLMSSDDSSKVPAIQLFLGGAFSGAVGKTITAPFDRVKILYQVNLSPKNTITNKQNHNRKPQPPNK